MGTERDVQDLYLHSHFFIFQIVEDPDEYFPILSDDNNIDIVSEPESKSSDTSASAIRSNVSWEMCV